MHGDLAQYAEGIKGTGSAAVQYQCADRVPARAAQRFSRFSSAGEHRFGGAAERRELSPPSPRGTADVGNRRRHSGGSRARGLAVPRRPVRARGSRRTILLSTAKQISFAEVSRFRLCRPSIGPSAFYNASCPKKRQRGQAGVLDWRVQLRSFDAVCRLVECNVGIRRRSGDYRRAPRQDHVDPQNRGWRTTGPFAS